ncbi:MAG: PIN domain-containing protein [bacterium]
MALVLRIEKRKMGQTAKNLFSTMESGNTVIHVPAMALAEILYHSEKRRIKCSLADVADYMKQHSNCREFPFNFAVAEATEQIKDIRELHDRLIAGTARLLNLELITNDPIIQASSFVKTIW